MYIDVSISCAVCHTSFASAIQAKEKDKYCIYKAEVEKLPHCKFLPFVIGSVGGFGSCARQVWDLLKFMLRRSKAVIGGTPGHRDRFVHAGVSPFQ